MAGIIEDIQAAANSNRLPILLASIKDALLRGRSAYHDLCIYLAEAKATFPATQEFGKWCSDNDVRLAKNDRAAAIEMGEWGSERLTAVLAKTHSTSLRLICEEGRVPNSGKCNHNANTTTKKSKAAPSLDQAAHVIDRMARAGEAITREAIVKEAGVGEGTAQKAMALHRAKTVDPAPEAIILSASMQKKFEAKLRAVAKQMQLDFETAVRAEVKRRHDEIGFTHYFTELQRVENLLNSPRWAIMPVAHFKMILACLHPDNARPGHEARFNEAFTLFNRYKLKLVDLSQEKDEKARLKRIELRGNPLPRTVEEMEAARAKVKAENQERARKAAATRKARQQEVRP